MRRPHGCCPAGQVFPVNPRATRSISPASKGCQRGGGYVYESVADVGSDGGDGLGSNRLIGVFDGRTCILRSGIAASNAGNFYRQGQQQGTARLVAAAEGEGDA